MEIMILRRLVVLCVTSVTLAASASPAMGLGWALQTTLTPAGASDLQMRGISCSATPSTNCTSVGSYFANPGSIAQRWNGTSWSSQTMATPAGASQVMPRAITCLSASDCYAVGSYYTTTSAYKPLAEHWNGTAWSVQTTPAFTVGAWLVGISCTTTSQCTAVGYHTDPTFAHENMTWAMRWNGTSWSTQTTPNPAGYGSAELSSVACTSATSCLAVGQWTDGPTIVYGTMTMSWNGTTWTLLTTAQPPAGPARPNLASVSCSSAAACTAVGGYGGIDGSSGSVIERWNGSTWTVQTNPSPAGDLHSVSCPTATKCVAVGESASGLAAYATVWNGTSWTAQSPPMMAGASNGGLQAVACLGATACEAVGYQYPGPKTLADGYTG
jgi:hypothetical protein